MLKCALTVIPNMHLVVVLYLLRFREADGYVRKMNIGDLRYSAVYKANGDLRRVNDLNDRRVLLEQDVHEIEDMDEDITIPSARRLALLSCDDCETVWNLLCNGGMDTLCDDITYGDEPLVDEPDVENSLTTMVRRCISV